MKWAIKTQRLFDGTGNPVVRDALVVIENAHIVAVGPASQVALPDGIALLDVGDRLVHAWDDRCPCAPALERQCVQRSRITGSDG